MADPTAFDPYAPAVLAAGPEAYADLARHCPLFHFQGRFDFFIASDFDDITNRILQDREEWTIEDGSSQKPLPPEQRAALLTEGDRHKKIRLVVQRGFSPKEIARLSQIVNRLADELIDKALAHDSSGGDLFELFVMPLPARLMCLMLGVPETDFMTYKHWSDKFFFENLNVAGTNISVEEMEKISGPIFALIAERNDLLAKKGLEPDVAHIGTVLPNDFLSRFMCERVDGALLDKFEILGLMLGIILGGNETTMNLIGNLIWRLLEVPERWEAIKADPSLIETAIEESLRVDPPIIGLFRAARQDVRVNGGLVPKGAKIMYNIAAANRNPEIWPDPDSFRLDRPIATLRRHIAFSSGHHLCLGAPLARMEVRLVIEKLAERMPGLRIAGEAERVAGFNLYGKSKMPVLWS